jgi:hypothetical protein
MRFWSFGWRGFWPETTASPSVRFEPNVKLLDNPACIEFAAVYRGVRYRCCITAEALCCLAGARDFAILHLFHRSRPHVEQLTEEILRTQENIGDACFITSGHALEYLERMKPESPAGSP